MNELLYHGTTETRWANPCVDNNGRLYVVVDSKDAENYAAESGESEWDDEIHQEGGFMPKLILVQFQINSLINLAMREFGVELEPDWGWVDSKARETGRLPESFTWEESLKSVGSFCVYGFEEKYKALGVVLYETTLDENTLGVTTHLF
jgi:hypothetical protein